MLKCQKKENHRLNLAKVSDDSNEKQAVALSMFHEKVLFPLLENSIWLQEASLRKHY